MNPSLEKELRRSQVHVLDAIRHRDQAIISACCFLSSREVAKAVGLSHQQVNRIRKKYDIGSYVFPTDKKTP